MKKYTLTTLFICLLVGYVAAIAMAHMETSAEYDKRLEKEIAELQDHLPSGGEDDDNPMKLQITKVEKRGRTIITTMETKGEWGWIAMAESMGGVEKFKAWMQRQYAEQALMVDGLRLDRNYTLRYRFVDNGKEVCTVDVNILIIQSMISDYDEDNPPEYHPTPLPQELWEKVDTYEKYLKEGGYPPDLTAEELHIIREFIKYKKY